MIPKRPQVSRPIQSVATKSTKLQHATVEIWAVDVSIGSEIRPDGSQPGGIAKASSGRDSTNWSLFMKIEDLEPEKCEQTAKYEVESADVI